MRGIKKIIFCGYSFPDADIHIKYLLKRLELGKNNPLEVIVINHFEGKRDDIMKDMEKERYIRFFKNYECINYTDMSFEKFCESKLSHF